MKLIDLLKKCLPDYEVKLIQIPVLGIELEIDKNDIKNYLDYDVLCFDIVDDKIEITIQGCKL